MERDEDRLAPLVHVDHRIEQRIDHEVRAVIRHAVEVRPLASIRSSMPSTIPDEALLELAIRRDENAGSTGGGRGHAARRHLRTRTARP